ncbi:MAG: hypothetical protein ABI310_01185, partial [Microbacteriaceae bacterium]
MSVVASQHRFALGEREQGVGRAVLSGSVDSEAKLHPAPFDDAIAVEVGLALDPNAGAAAAAAVGRIAPWRGGAAACAAGGRLG